MTQNAEQPMSDMSTVVIYLLLMLGNHGYFRLAGTYLHKATCEAAAKENNSGFGYGKPAKPGELQEWREWEARCIPFSGKAPPSSYLTAFTDDEKESDFLKNRK
jgi:hypothetical protein